MSADQTPEEIARALSGAQKRAEWYGTGHRRLKKVTAELADMGLVDLAPAMMGWCWRPTALGLAVQSILMETQP